MSKTLRVVLQKDISVQMAHRLHTRHGMVRKQASHIGSTPTYSNVIGVLITLPNAEFYALLPGRYLSRVEWTNFSIDMSTDLSS